VAINHQLPVELKCIKIKVIVTNEPGESFLDKMIALVEGASRQKTPNEIALTSFCLYHLCDCLRDLKPLPIMPR
jgi:hypothetical protein